MATSGYGFAIPQPFWTEQNPQIWIDGLKDCLNQINEPAPDAIGLTGQMHGAVCLDKSDKVLRPAILWNDQRTIEQCKFIENSIGEKRYRSITCNPALTGFQIPKILWIRENEPRIFDQIHSILLPKDYVRFVLTGEKATDTSDASGTGVFDVPNRRWSNEIIEALDLRINWFPDCFESSLQTGKTRAFLPEEKINLKPGIPVVVGAGDQAAGAVGIAVVKPGLIGMSLGTSGVVFSCLDKPNYLYSGETHTFCHANGGWHAMTVMLNCGGAINWLKSMLFPELSFEEIDGIASSAPPGSNNLTFLPYLSGERSPINDPFARGVWAGLDLSHGRPELFRSLLEGVSCGLFDGFNSLKSQGATCSIIRITSGGAKSDFWVQMIADLFQVPCELLQVDEGPAFGAALIAASHVEKISLEQVSSMVKIKKTVEGSGADYDKVFKRYQDLYQALIPWVHS